MRFMCLGLIALTAITMALPALAASMEPRFGNTMVGTRPDGTVMKLYYNQDHTFSGEITPPGSPVALQAKGTWQLEGDQLCVFSDAGPGDSAPVKSCAQLKGDHVGDKWQTSVRGPDGQPVMQSVEIVKGR